MDDDIDDKKTAVDIILEKDAHIPKIKSKRGKALKKSDDANIDILGGFDVDFEIDMLNAEQELQLIDTSVKSSNEVLNDRISKLHIGTKDNDDSDKSSDSDVWAAAPEDDDNSNIDVDNLLGNIRNINPTSREFGEDAFDENNFEELSAKIDGLEDKVTELIEKIDNQDEILAKIVKGQRKMLDMLCILAGKSPVGKIVEGTKTSIVNESDVDDPVNNSTYFTVLERSKTDK